MVRSKLPAARQTGRSSLKMSPHTISEAISSSLSPSSNRPHLCSPNFKLLEIYHQSSGPVIKHKFRVHPPVLSPTTITAWLWLHWVFMKNAFSHEERSPIFCSVFAPQIQILPHICSIHTLSVCFISELVKCHSKRANTNSQFVLITCRQEKSYCSFRSESKQVVRGRPEWH